jgi:hypothetical protein
MEDNENLMGHALVEVFVPLKFAFALHSRIANDKIAKIKGS